MSVKINANQPNDKWFNIDTNKWMTTIFVFCRFQVETRNILLENGKRIFGETSYPRSKEVVIHRFVSIYFVSQLRRNAHQRWHMIHTAFSIFNHFQKLTLSLINHVYLFYTSYFNIFQRSKHHKQTPPVCSVTDLVHLKPIISPI